MLLDTWCLPWPPLHIWKQLSGRKVCLPGFSSSSKHTHKSIQLHIESLHVHRLIKSSSKYNPNFKNQSLTTLHVINSLRFPADGRGIVEKNGKEYTGSHQQMELGGPRKPAQVQVSPGYRLGAPPSDKDKKYKFSLTFSFAWYVKSSI